jgi:D-alanyl-lipoteichoic acid acyltransferase DltB (MBOAT superfamily)
MTELVLVLAIEPDLIRGPVTRHDALVNSTQHPRRSDVDTLISILSIAALLGLFGVIAAIIGEDTRDGFRDDPYLLPRYR